MISGQQTLTGLEDLDDLVSAALELVGTADQDRDDWWLPDEALEAYSQKERWLADLALALDDIDMARTIDSVALRAEISSQILCHRNEVDGLHEMIRLARAVDDREIRHLIVGGLVQGIDHSEVVPTLINPVRDLPGGEIRDRALAVLAIRDSDHLHLERIGDSKVRDRALVKAVVANPSPALVKKALGRSRRPDGESLLIPGVRGAIKLGDRKLKQRAAIAASRMPDLETRIVAFDLLGGSSFRNFYSRYAMRLLRQLPLPTDDPEDPQDGTQETSLIWMAIRHQSPQLAERLRFDWTRDHFFLVLSIDLADPDLARQITEPSCRAEALASIARHTADRDLADEALWLDWEHEFRRPQAMFAYLITRIGILRQAGTAA